MELTKFNKDRRQKREPIDHSTMVYGYGKVPPQAKALEEAVLGAIMLEKNAFDAVIEILKPECFYVDAHQRIFSAMQSLTNKSQPIDILTVTEELRTKEELEMVGGAYYVTKLTNSVVSSAHIESHARIIQQKFTLRRLAEICATLARDAMEEGADPFDLLDQGEEMLSQLGQNTDIGDMTHVGNVLVKAMQQIQEWRSDGTQITGTPSGFADLDRATRGWQNGDLIIIAARPSVGKTAFAINILRNAAMSFLKGSKKSVAIWSLEMKSLMLGLRMMAAESGEMLHRIQTGQLDENAMKRIYKDGVQKLAQLNIFFDDNSGLTIQKLRSKARKMKRKNNLGLIIVDYLQLMQSDERAGNREQEVSRISRALKNLAQELDIPIIALSQMSREFEKRDGHRRVPMLSDLRESGSLEQDADLVIFLWSPTDGEIEQDASLIYRRYLGIAKQRNGVLLKMDLDFKDEIQLFSQAVKLPGFVPVDMPD